MLSPTRQAQLFKLARQPEKAAPAWLTMEMVRELPAISAVKLALMLAMVRRELNTVAACLK